MYATLAELAALVHGRLTGNGEVAVRDVAPLHLVESDELTFITTTDRCRELEKTGAAGAIVPFSVAADRLSMPCIQVDHVQEAVATIVRFFRPPRASPRIGISPQAVVSPTARIAPDADVHPLAFIGDDVVIGSRTVVHSGVRVLAGCQIAEDVTLFPNAVLYENTVVGPRCIVHAGAILGAYGFGYDSGAEGHRLSPQLGFVVLEADVEVGAVSTIDRGTYGPTRIGQGTKIDNCVMVAHNCRIGKHNILCAQVGIAGSTTTGDFVVIAGQAGVRDHVRIGNHVVLGAMSGVMTDVPDHARWVGIPATPEREQMIKQAVLSKLPQMRRQLKELYEMVEKLAESDGTSSHG